MLRRQISFSDHHQHLLGPPPLGCCVPILPLPVPPPDRRQAREYYSSHTEGAHRKTRASGHRCGARREAGQLFPPDFIYFIYCSVRHIWYHGQDERSDAKSVHVRGLESPRICKLSLDIINQPGTFLFVYWFLYVVSDFINGYFMAEIRYLLLFSSLLQLLPRHHSFFARLAVLDERSRVIFWILSHIFMLHLLWVLCYSFKSQQTTGSHSCQRFPTVPADTNSLLTVKTILQCCTAQCCNLWLTVNSVYFCCDSLLL